jgi:hypothetical protein
LVLLPAGPALSQTTDSTTTAQECCTALNYPISARILALAGAVVADTDQDMVLANPAGLVGLRRAEFLVHYQKLPADAQILGLSFATRPYRFGTFALAYTLVDYGNFEGFDVQGNPTGAFYSQVHVIGATFATSLAAGLSGGLTYRAFVWVTPVSDTSETGGASGATQLIDAGLQYHPPWNRWLALGASVNNAGLPLQVVNYEQSDKPPMRGRLGARYEVAHFFSPDTTVTGSISTEVILGGPGGAVLATSAEVSVGGVVAVRAGWRGARVAADPQSGGSLGIGLHVQRYRLDVARSLKTSELFVGNSPFNVTFGVSF